MKRTLIRYKTKPERTAENEALIKAVFAELEANAPEGLRYMSLKLADGSFVHFVENDAKDPAGVLQSLTGIPGIPERHQGSLHRAAAIERGDDRRQL